MAPVQAAKVMIAETVDSAVICLDLVALEEKGVVKGKHVLIQSLR